MPRGIKRLGGASSKQTTSAGQRVNDASRSSVTAAFDRWRDCSRTESHVLDRV